MKRMIMLVAGFCLGVVAAQAHLCNDVFAQAKDNLAVKVDIRDGQLRINQTAGFRVYLLNTMDRGIGNIQLEIVSPDFTAEVKPSPDWKSFPVLNSVIKGGQKEYFDVTLNRKGGTADGKYKIGLRLFNGKDRKMEFKTVDLADALSALTVPFRDATLAIDGTPSKTEWANALLCSSFDETHKEGRYNKDTPSSLQTRIRFCHDDQNLYGVITCPDVGTNDVVTLYAAPDAGSKPQSVTIDLVRREITAPAGVSGLVCKGTKPGEVEFQIPLAALGVSGKPSFLLNLARARGKTMAYMMGNAASVESPMVYATFVLGK